MDVALARTPDGPNNEKAGDEDGEREPRHQSENVTSTMI
jgi:hypothetical protein